MILTESVIYRGQEIKISELKPQSAKLVLIECPDCKKQRYANYGRVKNNQRCHLCALKLLIKLLPVGNKYNRYTIMASSEQNGFSICKCNCGNIKEVRNYELTSGSTQSCGCLQKEKASYNLKKLSNKQHRENHPNWKGGISKLPYAFEFNDSLKESIRKRDNYECQNCGMTEEEHLIVVGTVLNVHHIDYDKNNCQKENLITLCFGCNIKANFNRDYWKVFFSLLKQKNPLEEVLNER